MFKYFVADVVWSGCSVLSVIDSGETFINGKSLIWSWIYWRRLLIHWSLVDLRVLIYGSTSSFNFACWSMVRRFLIYGVACWSRSIGVVWRRLLIMSIGVACWYVSMVILSHSSGSSKVNFSLIGSRCYELQIKLCFCYPNVICKSACRFGFCPR